MISEKLFKSEILPHLLKSKRAYDCEYSLFNYFQAIVYRLKTGCQWRQLPLKEFFANDQPVWQSVYYHYHKWCKESFFKTIWQEFSLKLKDNFDLSLINLDGSHTPAKRGGDEVQYQTRKKCKTTNMLFLTDKKGNFLACSDPVSGNHHDSYNLVDNFKIMKKFPLLKRSETLIINADSGFDVKSFVHCCFENNVLPNIKDNPRNRKVIDDFDSRLLFPDDYKHRFVIERSFAWLDSFKLLLVRYEVKSTHWLQLHFLAFFILLIYKYHIL